MAIYQVKTFADIIAAAREELKIPSSDTTTINRIKRNINTIYLDHVCSDTQWPWLRRTVDLVHYPYTAVTCSVTQDSRTVTLSGAESNSKTGYLFTTGDEIYKIESHVGGSATVVLESEYVETTNATASGRIWTNALVLPSDCVEIEKWWIRNRTTPREVEGLHIFRERQLLAPHEEGAPRFGTVWDWSRPDKFSAVSGAPNVTHRASAGLLKTLTFDADPSTAYPVGTRIQVSGAGIDSYNGRFVVSSLDASNFKLTYTGTLPLTQTSTADGSITLTTENGETTDNRYLEFLIHPSQDSSDKHLIHVDYIAQPIPLENDADEPLMPLSDRSVLLYGALSMSWVRERNEKTAQINEIKFERKLAKMLGKLDSHTDHVRLQVSKNYLAIKRYRRRLPYDFTRFD